MKKFKTWMLKKARQTDRRVLLEEALLVNRAWEFLIQRLYGLTAIRVFQTVVILTEFVLFAPILSQKSLTQIYLWMQLSVVLSAFWWGALEPFRGRLGHLTRFGSPAELQQVIVGALRLSATASIGVVALGAGLIAYQHLLLGQPWHLFSSFIVAIFFRTAMEIPYRSLHSIVFAHRRVHRPLWSIALVELAAVGILVGCWGLFGIWGFSWALALTALLRLGVSLHFVRRAYETLQLPLSWNLALRSFRPRTTQVSIHHLVAGMPAVGSMLNRASPWLAIPALAFATSNEAYGFGLGVLMHLASPLLGFVSDWAQVFYPDAKRLTRDDRFRRGDELLTVLHRGAWGVGAVGVVWLFGVSAIVIPKAAWMLPVLFAPALVFRAGIAPLALQSLTSGENRYYVALGFFVAGLPLVLFSLVQSPEVAGMAVSLGYFLLWGAGRHRLSIRPKQGGLVSPTEWAVRSREFSQNWEIGLLKTDRGMEEVRRRLDQMLRSKGALWCYPRKSLCRVALGMGSRLEVPEVCVKLAASVRSFEPIEPMAATAEKPSLSVRLRTGETWILRAGRAAPQGFKKLPLFARRAILSNLIGPYPWTIRSLGRFGLKGTLRQSSADLPDEVEASRHDQRIVG